MTPPGRPREFDIDVALDAAIEAFWAHGYEATSMADLMQATGLAKGSLYKAFGDKHSLYVAALKRYLGKMSADVLSVIEAADSPAEGIRRWLEFSWHYGNVGGGLRRGCLAVNTVVELAPHDPTVERLLAEHLQRMQASLTRVVARGQELGEFRSDASAASLAQFLTVFAAGVVTSSKLSFLEGQEQGLPDVALEALRSPVRVTP
jgi:TetR/AcrR family transcriptional repressor of nem operon